MAELTAEARCALEDYELGERVAEPRGTRSYRGTRRGTRDAVVIRVVHAQGRDVALSRCQQEFQVGTGIEHASVVRYLDFQTIPEGALLIQEDFGGAVLEQLIPARGFDVRLVLDLAIQLSQALAAIHAHGVVHAAVSPESILVNLHTRTAKLGALGAAFRFHHDYPLDFVDADDDMHVYEAPEQSGRIAGVVDYRSDLYSLGATLYRMLAGVAPFRADDALALAYSHIAGVQEPLEKRAPHTPPAVARIVDKLLAKNPSARYQGAPGLTADLVHCRNELDGHGEIAPFGLGEHDVPARIEFPGRLYGREQQLARLLTALARVREGASAIVWVTGEAGSGKSALARSLIRSAARAGAIVLTGKVEQRGADEPYAALSSAITGLVHKLLTEPAHVLEAFRQKLADTLGANLPLVVEALPALATLVGDQDRRSELRVTARSGVEGRARLHFAFTSFLGLLAQRERPLVLFLDDLQWVSPALAQLLTGVFSQPALPHLLFIGGYRTDEADAESPLGALLAAPRSAGIRAETIELGNIDQAHVAELLRDTLRAPCADVAQLAQLVWRKAGGHPLGTRTFIEELETLGHLRPDPTSGHWVWDLATIGELPSNTDMLGSLQRKLSRLPAATRGELWVASRVASTISVSVLAALLDKTSEQTWHALLPALSQHLVVAPEPTASTQTPPGSYPALRFAHDRVQQACAELSVAEDVQALHGRIGRLLFDTLSPAERELRLFEIVDHLNLDTAPEPDTPERQHLVELILRAARRAHATAAYAEGLRYFERALALLSLPTAWSSARSLTFELHVGLAECAGAIGMTDRARDLLTRINAHVRTPTERVTLTRAWVGLEVSPSACETVLKLFRSALAELGVEPPATAEAAAASRDLEWPRLEARLREHTLDELVAWPETADERAQAVLELLALATPAAYLVSKPLLDWIVLKSLSLSLEYGVTKSSSYSFVAYGLHLAARSKNPARAVEYGRVGLRLSERFPTSDSGRIHYVFGLFLCHWQEPADHCLEYFRTALVRSLEMGDLYHARIIPFVLPLLHVQLGHNVAVAGRDREAGSNADRLEHYLRPPNLTGLLPAFLRSLQGATADPTSLELPDIQEKALEQALANDRGRLATFLVLKLELLAINCRWEQSLAFVRHWDELILEEQGAMLFGIEYVFFSAVAMAALQHAPEWASDADLAARLEQRVKLLQGWAELCPMNFANKLLLVQAELSSQRGAYVKAAELYDEAIEAATRAGFTHEVALANERAAAFYARRGRTNHARGYLEDAREAYLHWGATAKAQALLCAPTAPAARKKTSRAHELDLISVIKASRALSSETRLYDLVQQVLQISAENAGAERALLVFEANDALRVAARWPPRGLPIDPQVGEPLVASHGASAGILRYVLRTRESLVLDNAAEEGAFTEDPTVKALAARAILAMPLSRCKPEAGVLYLENRLTPRAFVPERLAVLDLLIRQASILIDNARFLERTQRLNAALATENHERLEAEAAVRTSERRLAGFLDGLPVGAVILSPNAQLHFMNRAAMQVLGIAPPAIARMPRLYRNGSTEPERPETLPWTRALRGESVWDHGVSVLRGELRIPLMVWASPLRDPQGRVEYAIIAFQDVSETKRAAEERARLEERVRQAQKLESIGRFASGVAHDFNNLLVPILGYAALAANAQRHEAVVESLEHVQEAAQQAAELTRTLLAFARKQTLSMVPLQLNDEVAAIPRILDSAVRERIELLQDFAPDLPGVCADRSQLRQVAMNLVINACDAMPQGGRLMLATKHVVLPQPLLGQTEIPAGDYVVFTVADTGKGMDAATQARAFEPFFTTKEEGKGTGLGLAMVFGIVEQHRGYIRLRSAPGQGTTFEVWLPSIREPAATLSADSAFQVGS